MKLLGRGLRTGATQVVLEKVLLDTLGSPSCKVQTTMKTMTNHRLVTKV